MNVSQIGIQMKGKGLLGAPVNKAKPTTTKSTVWDRPGLHEYLDEQKQVKPQKGLLSM